MQSKLACIAIVASNSICATASAQQDRCADVLMQSVVEVRDDRTVNQHLKDWVRSENFSNHIRQRGDSFNVNIPLPDGPIFGFGASNRSDTTREFRDFLNTGSIQNLTERQSEYIFAQFLPPDVVEAWKSCMERSGTRGVVNSSYSTSSDSTIVTIELRYLPISLDDAQPRITNDPLVLGGKIIGDTQIQNNQILDTISYVMTIQRDADSEVVVHIQTTRGHVAVHVPAGQNPNPDLTATLVTSQIPIALGDYAKLKQFESEWAVKLAEAGHNNSVALAHIYARRLDNYWFQIEALNHLNSFANHPEDGAVRINQALFRRMIAHHPAPIIINAPLDGPENHLLNLAGRAEFRSQFYSTNGTPRSFRNRR